MYEGIERHGGALSAYYKVKKANLKTVHNVWFQLYDIIEGENTMEKIEGSVVIRGRDVVGWICTAQRIFRAVKIHLS